MFRDLFRQMPVWMRILVPVILVLQLSFIFLVAYGLYTAILFLQAHM